MTCRTGDGSATGGAAFGEQLSEAIGAVWLLVATGEPLAGQAGVTVGARETLAVPRLTLVGHSAGGDDLGGRGRGGVLDGAVVIGAVVMIGGGGGGVGQVVTVTA